MTTPRKTTGAPHTATVRVVERFTALAVAVAIIIFAMVIIFRDEPVQNQNTVVFMRILLALMMGILGGTIPGLLNVKFTVAGLVVRALGALALVVLTLVYTPTVLPNLRDPTQAMLDRFQKGDVKEAIARIDDYWLQPKIFIAYMTAERPERQRMATEWASGSDDRIGEIAGLLRFIGDTHTCIDQGDCSATLLCPVVFEQSDHFLQFFDDLLRLWATSSDWIAFRNAKLLIWCDCIEELRRDRSRTIPDMATAAPICTAAEMDTALSAA